MRKRTPSGDRGRMGHAWNQSAYAPRSGGHADAEPGRGSGAGAGQPAEITCVHRLAGGAPPPVSCYSRRARWPWPYSPGTAANRSCCPAPLATVATWQAARGFAWLRSPGTGIPSPARARPTPSPSATPAPKATGPTIRPTIGGAGGWASARQTWSRFDGNERVDVGSLVKACRIAVCAPPSGFPGTGAPPQTGFSRRIYRITPA